MTESQAPEKVIINGQEYSPEDATLLVELGSKYKKMESDLNTSLDKVYPEYTKATQKLKEFETQLTEKNAEIERFKAENAKRQQEIQTPDEVKKARQAAREIGLADKDYLNEQGYMTRDQVTAMLAEEATKSQAADRILKQATSLEQQIDGSDGRVPFDQDAVLTYAAAKGIPDLQEAYDKLNERGNAKWKETQIAKAERPGLTTIQPGGKKAPVRQKMTDDNLKASLSEWLDQIAQA